MVVGLAAYLSSQRRRGTTGKLSTAHSSPQRCPMKKASMPLFCRFPMPYSLVGTTVWICGSVSTKPARWERGGGGTHETP